MYYNTKIRFDADGNKIAADISDVQDYDSCVKSMHNYFVSHMEEDGVNKICVTIHDADDDRCKVVSREVWIKGQAIS